ncbi:MAG: PilZ domain-containing protein [Geothrix sp.]|nr:PilZ domain-containing protein [Geothrix sp.]
MNQGKITGLTGRGTPVEDPAFIRQTMQDLFQQEMEFSIKVEGTHTLPYTAWLRHLDFRNELIHLKLIRPLPHEMAPGAAFEMLFSLGDQRFVAPSIFQGREDYLLYRFTVPVLLMPSDRRRHKRYPFRPREKAYVIAQDGGVPGHGLSGPLVNLSLGGLAFRVDRVMRLDDHMRVTPGPGFFERGKAFPMLKIRDLPNLPVFDARGVLANAWERDGEVVIGIQFGDLGEAESREILGVLTLRDHLQRASSATATEGSKDPGGRSPSEPKGPAARISPAGSLTPDALRRLGRRSTRLVLAMAPGPEREQIRQALGAAGFLRLDCVDTLDQALADFRTVRTHTHPLLMLDSGLANELALADIRALQKELGETRELPVALVTREEPVPDSEDPLIRPLPWPTGEGLVWLPLLDELVGLD